MTGNPHIDQTLPLEEIDPAKLPYNRIVDFPLEFQIRAKDKTQSVTDAVEWLIKHIKNDAWWNCVSNAMDKRSVRKELVIKAKVVVNNGLCICEMSTLMSKGCQCGGN